MERYVLKHFYYGQFVKDNQPMGDMRLMAKTTGISNEAVAEMLQLALIPPLKGNPQTSWAIVRGKSEAPFVLAASSIGEAGQSVLHYAVLPSDLLRAMGGNLRLFKPFLEAKVPTYSRVGIALDPFIVSEVQPPSAEQEVDDILDLMMFTRNRMNVMEAILGAVVKGMPLVVVNAPPDYESRFTFVTGLLALLPPSVRFAVTCATHTLKKTKIDAQIKFLAKDNPVPSDAVVFDWEKAQVSGMEVQEDYSRFIMSQLRLDAELVVQQTRRLTAIASWRVKQGDRLADALAYASQRRSMDDAVINGQPVEVRAAAKMLESDPTLDDDLRLSYAQHLLSLSVALGELDHVEPLGIMLNQNIDLADAAHASLKKSIHEGAAGDTYDLLSKWLSNPLGPQGQRWIDLSQEAAVVYFNDMADLGDVKEMQLFLRDVDKAGVLVGANYLMPKLIDIAKPMTVIDPSVAIQLFVYACRNLTVDRIAELLKDGEFLVQLPKPLQAFVRTVQADVGTAKAGLLVKAVGAFKVSKRLILVRLVELAMHHKHGASLVDENVLKQLLVASQTDWGKDYFTLIGDVVKELSAETNLLRLSHTGQRLLLQLLISIGYYRELANQMKNQSRLLYSIEKQPEYARMIQRVFAEVPVPDEQVPMMLETIVNEGIRSLPMAMAFVGVLQSKKEPNDTTDAVAGDLADALQQEPGLIQVFPPEAMRTTMLYHMRRRNVDGTLRCAPLLADVCCRDAAGTIKIMADMYKKLGKHPRWAAYRMEMLRRYIRYMSPESAQEAVPQLGKLLDKAVQTQLAGTLALKIVMRDQNLNDFAKALHTTADFLEDTATAYTGRNTPTEGGLRNELDSLPGGLSSNERESIAVNMVQLGRAVCELGTQHKRVRNSNNDRRIDGLLSAQENPQSAIEVLRVMGGFLSDGKRYAVKLNAPEHPHPLPRRSSTTLLEEVATVCNLLTGMLRLEDENLNAGAVREELNSMWKELASDARKELGGDFPRDLQRMADLVPLIEASGDARALEDTGLGKRLESNRARPRNALEFYRYVAGYYYART